MSISKCGGPEPYNPQTGPSFRPQPQPRGNLVAMQGARGGFGLRASAGCGILGSALLQNAYSHYSWAGDPKAIFYLLKGDYRTSQLYYTVRAGLHASYTGDSPCDPSKFNCSAVINWQPSVGFNISKVPER